VFATGAAKVPARTVSGNAGGREVEHQPRVSQGRARDRSFGGAPVAGDHPPQAHAPAPDVAVKVQPVIQEFETEQLLAGKTTAPVA
jgi:hypothetical protein